MPAGGNRFRQAAYRRGLVLGLTLAETFLLIIFILLLALQLARNDEEKELNELRDTKESYDKLAVLLGEPSGLSQKEILDTFTELYLTRKETKELRDQLALQQEQVAAAAQLQAEVADLKTENSDLRSRVEYQASKPGGLPPCWVAKDGTGVPLYGVAVTSNGLFTFEIPLSEWDARRSKLPLAGIKIGVVQVKEQFGLQVRPLHQWSQAQPCRHFVELYDCTAVAEKEIYKANRTAVEKFFFTRLVPMYSQGFSCPTG